jgi:hypothetical protein
VRTALKGLCVTHQTGKYHHSGPRPVTPRAEVDEALIAVAPVKQPRQVITMPPPTVEPTEKLLVASFDGSARVKRSGGAYRAIIWQLPEWTIVSAASEYAADLTVNEAEYHGLLLCFDLLTRMDRGRIAQRVTCRSTRITRAKPKMPRRIADHAMTGMQR